MFRCTKHPDDLCSSPDLPTFCNESLGHSSTIDLFMSNAPKTNICNVLVVESGINLSIHRPQMCSVENLDINLLHSCVCTGSKLKVKNSRLYCWRWDKSDLSLYYDAFLNLLNNIAVADCINCEYDCNNQKHCHSFNSYYGNIAAAL